MRYICNDCEIESDSRKEIIEHAQQKDHSWLDTRPYKVIKKGKWFIGQVGVDSGTVMIVDPGYVKDMSEISSGNYQDWLKFCNFMDEHHHNPEQYHQSVVTSTAHGDGLYPVYATVNKDGRVTKLEVSFDRYVSDKDEAERPQFDTCVMTRNGEKKIEGEET